MNEDDRHLDDALLEAAREVGYAYTPKDLTERNVRRVRFVPRDKLGEVLQKAVQKALESRAEHERGLTDLVGGVQAGLLGLLRGASEFESARRSVSDQRAWLTADIAEIARMRRPGILDERDLAIDRLERRVAKLVEALHQSERALDGALQSRAIEDGVASLHKVVRGLSANEEQFAHKRAMMADIFSANVELRARFAEARRGEG